MTGREIIDVLERFFVLAWFRYGALKSPDQNQYPPIIIWRYDADVMAADDIRLAESAITMAVESFLGNVNWVLYFSGRNWVLVPKRVKDLEDAGEYRSDTEILTMLAENDPSFGFKANSDLPALAKCIEGYLSQNSG
ncbi:MAG: hypothetical protein M3A44_04430 [Gammaproteobacteria bacterium]